MAHAVPARLDAHFGVDPPAADRAQALSPAAVPGDIRLSVYEDLSAIERDWRDFETHADCTVFQSFDWLATWQRHIGVRTGVRPAIVVGRDARAAFCSCCRCRCARPALRASSPGSARTCATTTRRCWRPDFAERFDRARFPVAVGRYHAVPAKQSRALQFDFINLTKMPAMVGAQAESDACAWA